MKGVFECSGFGSAHKYCVVGLRPEDMAVVCQPRAAVVVRHWYNLLSCLLSEQGLPLYFPHLPFYQVA
jgi:hypothetical protein